MTREEIEMMPAGREMDALIEERIFRNPRMFYFEKVIGNFNIFPCGNASQMSAKPYSTIITFAWDVADLISRQYLWWEIGREHLPNGYDTTGWEVSFYNDPDYKDKIVICAPSAPLAICRAALLAVEEKDA